MSCAAATTLALFAATHWLRNANARSTAGSGLAFGAAIGSRLSAIAFVGAPLLAVFALRGWAERRWTSVDGNARRWWLQIAAIVAVCALTIWALYRFAVGPVHPGGVSLPAPAFIAGLDRFFLHGRSGHPTFLLGQPSNRGWWYYYPVALLVKTPLPLLLLGLVGGIAVVRALRERRDWVAAVPLVSALAMLAVSMTVRVDLGVRLVLPIYPLLAIVAAQGVLELWRQANTLLPRVVIGTLLAASIVIAVRAHPDHLSYFNPIAGEHPERVLVDSNLDWGQDLYRLRDTLARRGITDSIRVAYFGTADLTNAGVPRARVLGLKERTTGWIAASETYLAGEWVGGAYMWLLDYPPAARIGPSMRLWYIPPRP
jgi:hypothetical protein